MTAPAAPCQGVAFGYDAEEEAWREATEVERRSGVPIIAYPCRVCHLWHVRACMPRAADVGIPGRPEPRR